MFYEPVYAVPSLQSINAPFVVMTQYSDLWCKMKVDENEIWFDENRKIEAKKDSAISNFLDNPYSRCGV